MSQMQPSQPYPDEVEWLEVYQNLEVKTWGEIPTKTKDMDIKTLDTLFSTYIRTRDTNNYLEIGTCCTCGRTLKRSEGQCGHCIPRAHMGTRWDEYNAHLQCESCNCFEGGRRSEHAQFIDRLHGLGTYEKLMQKASQVTKIDRYDRKAIGIELKAKLKRMENAK
jgi:hypothetical protein